MNIFFLSRYPETAAKYHCDQHCSKMMIEYAQLMSTAHHVMGSPLADQCYKIAHKNHPSTIWTRASEKNYLWLYQLWSALAQEFYNRRGKHHASWIKLKDVLCHAPKGLKLLPFSDPPQCMPDEYKRPKDCLGAYRDYYNGDKARFAKWEWPTSETPFWWNHEKAQAEA